MDGRVMGENLLRIGRDPIWLSKRLKSNGYSDAGAILLAVYHPEEDEMTFYPNESF